MTNRTAVPRRKTVKGTTTRTMAHYKQLMSEHSEGVAATVEADRAYFRGHPDEQSYLRAVIPGEFWPYDFPPSALVSVWRYADGSFSRRPLDDAQGVYSGRDARWVDQLYRRVPQIAPDHLRAWIG